MEKLPAITDQFEGDAAEVIPTTGSKKRGRRPGSGKVPGSGRKPGSKNKVPPDVREMILVRGKPIELLCDISRGVRVRVGPQAGPGEPQYAYPSLQERAAAAKILLDKLVPAAPAASAGTLAQEAAQADTAPEMSTLDVVRRLLFAANREARAKLPDGVPLPVTRDGLRRVLDDEPWSPTEPEEVEARAAMYRPAARSITDGEREAIERAKAQEAESAARRAERQAMTPDEIAAEREEQLAQARIERQCQRAGANPNVVRFNPNRRR